MLALVPSTKYHWLRYPIALHYRERKQDNWSEMLSDAEVAYNYAVREEIGPSPFEIDLGLSRKTLLDILSKNRSS